MRFINNHRKSFIAQIFKSINNVWKLLNGGNDKLLATTIYGGQGLQLENSNEKLTHQHVQQLINNLTFAWDQQLKVYKRKIDDNS